MADIGNFRLSTPETQILIELYRAHEELWNYAHKLYKSRSAKKASYISLQLAFQAATGMLLPVHIIKTKIKSYRTQFAKEHSLVLQARRNRSTSEEEYKPRYELYENLKFLSAVVHLRSRPGLEDDSTTAPVTQGTEGRSSLPDVEEHQDYPVYNSPPANDDDNDNDADENLSCDLSCDSVLDNKMVLRELIEQNCAHAQGLAGLDSNIVERQGETAFDDGSSFPDGIGHNSHLPTESRPQGADQELFSPLLRAQSLNKTARLPRNAGPRGSSTPRSKKRRHNVEEEEEDVDETDAHFLGAHRQDEDGEGEGGGGPLIRLVNYLVERMHRQERRRREKAALKRAERAEGQSGDRLWARYLVQQLNDIANPTKKQLLKLKISQMVLDCRMEELEKQ